MNEGFFRRKHKIFNNLQLKNVEPSSIRIFKHRLKQKMNLAKEDDLIAFIQKLNSLSK